MLAHIIITTYLTALLKGLIITLYHVSYNRARYIIGFIYLFTLIFAQNQKWLTWLAGDSYTSMYITYGESANKNELIKMLTEG